MILDIAEDSDYLNAQRENYLTNHREEAIKSGMEDLPEEAGMETGISFNP
jgi:hypothetical protein